MELKKLREGITTGTCAAAAAKASVEWQLSGICPETVSIDTPGGKRILLDIVSEKFPWCSVIKDAGDDPDITDGCRVRVSVCLHEDSGGITFIAGEGIGTVTLPGLKIPVGEPAINPVPRQMIEKVIREAAGAVRAEVRISIPGGGELAKKTFNPRLGIEGGLSVLGTSGILKPMSEPAMIESLKVQMSVAAAARPAYLTFVLGETGERMVRQWLERGGKDVSKSRYVLVSNYMGLMLDEAVNLGVKKILIGGFAGKLVKLAADIMNTHSHIADGRMETLCTFAALAGAERRVVQRIYECRTVSAAIDILEEEQLSGIWDQISEKAVEKCRMRTGGSIDIGVVLMDEKGSLLGKSQNTEAVTA